jgi:type I restriction enzyme S subunit
MTRNWGKSSLAGLCTYFGDGDWIESKDQSSSGVRLVQTGNVGQGEFKDRAEKARYVSEETFTRLRCTEIFAGDCLISRLPDPPGRACLIPSLDERLITAVDCSIVRFDHDKILPEYFVYYAQTGEYLAAVEREATGTTRKRISRARLGQVPVPIAPLAEQRRIVTILDEAFEGIATAKAHAEQNLRNVRALFECYLSRALARGGRGWREISLADATGGVCTGPFGSLLHKSEYVENGIPLINPAHITDVGFAPDLRKSVSASTAQRLSSYLLRQGDIVIGRRGDMGRCAVVTAAEEGWLCGTGSFIIRSSSHCDARFLVRLLRSDDCKKRLEKIAGGAVMPNLSNSDLSDFVILLPPIDVQREILGDVDAMAQEVERLEFIGRKKISALTELQQSLLHQAFTGQF